MTRQLQIKAQLIVKHVHGLDSTPPVSDSRVQSLLLRPSYQIEAEWNAIMKETNR